LPRGDSIIYQHGGDEHLPGTFSRPVRGASRARACAALLSLAPGVRAAPGEYSGLAVAGAGKNRERAAGRAARPHPALARARDPREKRLAESFRKGRPGAAALGRARREPRAGAARVGAHRHTRARRRHRAAAPLVEGIAAGAELVVIERAQQRAGELEYAGSGLRELFYPDQAAHRLPVGVSRAGAALRPARTAHAAIHDHRQRTPRAAPPDPFLGIAAARRGSAARDQGRRAVPADPALDQTESPSDRAVDDLRGPAPELPLQPLKKNRRDRSYDSAPEPGSQRSTGLRAARASSRRRTGVE